MGCGWWRRVARAAAGELGTSGAWFSPFVRDGLHGDGLPEVSDALGGVARLIGRGSVRWGPWGFWGRWLLAVLLWCVAVGAVALGGAGGVMCAADMVCSRWCRRRGVLGAVVRSAAWFVDDRVEPLREGETKGERIHPHSKRIPSTILQPLGALSRVRVLSLCF